MSNSSMTTSGYKNGGISVAWLRANWNWNSNSYDRKFQHFFENYSLGQANLQFSLCDTQIYVRNQFDHFEELNLYFFAILKVLIFGFWRKFNILKVFKISKPSLCNTQIWRKIKFGNYRRANMQFWSFWRPWL